MHNESLLGPVVGGASGDGAPSAYATNAFEIVYLPLSLRGGLILQLNESS
jgi:hypothetical protein